MVPCRLIILDALGTWRRKFPIGNAMLTLHHRQAACQHSISFNFDAALSATLLIICEKEKQIFPVRTMASSPADLRT